MNILVSLKAIKQYLQAFQWKLAEQRSDVDLIVDEIDRIRIEELYPYGIGAQDKALKEMNDLLSSFLEQCRQELAHIKDPVEASFVFGSIREPSYNSIIAKIDTWLYQQTGDLQVFIQEIQ